MALDLFLDVQLLDRKPIIDRHRIRGLNMEEVGVQIEGISEAVCRIDTHHQGATVQFRQFQASRGGQAGFPHATFSAKQQNPHDCFTPALIGNKGFHYTAHCDLVEFAYTREHGKKQRGSCFTVRWRCCTDCTSSRLEAYSSAKSWRLCSEP